MLAVLLPATFNRHRANPMAWNGIRLCISFLKGVKLFVSPSVCPQILSWLPWTDFSRIWRLWRKTVRKTQITLRLCKSNGQLTWRPKDILMLPATLHCYLWVKWIQIARITGKIWTLVERAAMLSYMCISCLLYWQPNKFPLERSLSVEFSTQK
jgi:hypothetical protein